MQYQKKIAAALSAGTMLFALAGCGDDADHAADAHAEQTAANGDVFNDQDVAFASAMIPHHAQALVMVDLTRGRELSPEVQQLAWAIQAAQSPEIETMVDWLTAWDQPIPATMRDHVNADSSDGMDGHDMGDQDGMDDTDMPGMMTDEDLAELEAAEGQEFEELWLSMMIEHHEGAIQMAQDEQEDGVFEPAIELAESIESSQQAEIDQMQEFLAS